MYRFWRMREALGDEHGREGDQEHFRRKSDARISDEEDSYDEQFDSRGIEEGKEGGRRRGRGRGDQRWRGESQSPHSRDDLRAHHLDRAGGGYGGEGIVAHIDDLGLGVGGEDGSGVEEGLEEDKDEGSHKDEREASVKRFLSLSGALAQLDALLKALSLHESFSPEDKQALLFAFTCPVCDTPSSACTTTSDQIRAVHDAFRLIDADGDMVITITDLRDIKTWASDGCGTGLYLFIIIMILIVMFLTW